MKKEGEEEEGRRMVNGEKVKEMEGREKKGRYGKRWCTRGEYEKEVEVEKVMEEEMERREWGRKGGTGRGDVQKRREDEKEVEVE